MALINLRNALMAGKRLPYDAEVESLESSGTQYINTGIKPGPNTRVEITFAMTTFTANCGLFGARGNATADNNSYNLFIISNNGSRVRWDWSGNGQYQTSEAETSTDATYVLGAAGGNITRNGSTVMSVSASKAAINYPLYVFNFNNVGTPYSTGANARFWSVKIYDGQTLVFDAIPVRKGTVGYLYDRVSGKLFGNAGTGDFVLGPDVVPVEYIESHGTEYIDTGYVPNMNSVFDVTFSPNNVDFVGHPVHGNAYAATNKYTSSTVCPLTLWTGNNYNNRFFYAPVAMNGLVVGQKYHIVQSAASLSRDGVVVGNYDSSQMRTPLVEPMWLFACMNTQTERLYGLLRMYSWNVSELGISMRSMLPVRVGTEGAMMDTLTRRIYRNQGTGAFTYGNDLKYPIPAE